MKEKENLSSRKDSLPVIPGILLVLFLVATYVTYIRAYKSSNVYYFMSEEEVENFNPLKPFYGNN